MRRGVTIIEVLFAIMIVSVGLLGVISVFVVAGSQMKKATTNDAVAVTGRSAVHVFDTMGMRRPERWFAWIGANFSPVAGAGGQFFSPYPATQSFCIDSRFCVANAGSWSSAKFFPYTAPTNAAGPRMNRVAFFPPLPNGIPATVIDSATNLPSTKAADVTTTLAMNKLVADQIFWLEDDLAILRPGLDDVSKLNLPGVTNDRSQASFQVFPPMTVGKNTAPGPRPTHGHLSWMATLVPTVNAVYDPISGLPKWAGSDTYALSIVVFNDRLPDLALDDFNERTLGITLQDDGSSGGEVLLTNANAAALKIRPNDWLLISGQKQLKDGSGNVIDQVARFGWYRVTHCDKEPEQTATGFQFYASVFGQDIDASLANMQAVAVNGVATVHEKTIRLDYGSAF